MGKMDNIIDSIVALFENQETMVNTWNDAVLAEDPNSDKVICWTDCMNDDEQLTSLTHYDFLKAINKGDAHLRHDFYAFVDGKIITASEPWDFDFFDWRKLIEYVDKHPIK